MNSHGTSTLIPKVMAAVVAAAVAIIGIATGLKWLTLVALVLWFAAVYIFGRGNRNKPE